jgi:OOP family OmpA-OmpF porin
MKALSKSFLSLALVGTLAACGQGTAERSLADASSTAPAGGQFSQTLHDEYVNYAQAEFDEYDFRDATFFAQRAVSTGGGSVPAPQLPSERALPDEHVGALTTAHSRLTSALADGAADKAPQAAAEAQAAYDCWMQEAEENIQPNHIAACEERFQASMALVDEALAPPPAPVAAAEPVPMTVFFAFNSAELDDVGMQVIEEAAEMAADASIVDIVGHTDAVGTGEYNFGLSERRAGAVRDALVAEGVDASKINITAKGKTDLAVDSSVAEAVNRRAVIRIIE